MTDHSGEVYVSKVADLAKCDDCIRRNSGIFVKDIPANTIIQIDAADAVFTVLVVDPADRKIRIKGSQYLPELTDAVLTGSTFGGCMLKEGWIGVGMQLEILIPGLELPRLTTSMVKGISIVIGGTTRVQ